MKKLTVSKVKRYAMFVIGFICLIAAVYWITQQRIKADHVGVSSSVKGIASRCNTLAVSNKRIVCWEKELPTVIRQYGMKAVLSVVESLFIQSDDADQGGITKCHDVTHAIGRIGYEQYNNAGQAFSQCINICGYGCFMGVADGSLAASGDITKNNVINDICNQTIHPLPCAHALGHVMANRTGELIPSLTLCDGLRDDSMKEQCVSGASMELYDSANFVHATIPVPSDLDEFCDSLWGLYKTFCYNNRGYFSYIRDKNIASSVNLCMGASTLEDKKTCIFMLSAHMYYAFKGSETHMRQFCDSLDETVATDCIESTLIKSVISDPIARHGFGLCELYEAEGRSICFKTLGKYIEGNERGKDKRDRLCRQLKPSDQISCLAS